MEIPQSNSDLTIELTLFVKYSPEEMYTQLRSIKALVYETNWYDFLQIMTYCNREVFATTVWTITHELVLYYLRLYYLRFQDWSRLGMGPYENFLSRQNDYDSQYHHYVHQIKTA